MTRFTTSVDPSGRRMQCPLLEWRVVGSRVRGASHEATGLPCQDFVAWWQDAGLVFAACADGAGSATRAEEGAKAAVEGAVAFARQAHTGRATWRTNSEQLARRAMRGGRAAVRQRAAEANAPIGAFATTLLVCVVTPDTVSLAQVGDGVACIELQEEMCAPFPPQRGTYANETTFVTTGRRLPHVMLATYHTRDVTAIALSSDGLKQAITADTHTGEPYKPFFAAVFEFVRSGGEAAALERYLASVAERSDTQTLDDDKSLIVLAR